MQSNRGWWQKTLAAGLISSALFAGTAFAAGDGRMQSQKTMSRRTTTESPRVVSFKTERTDSWLCLNVSPFFCSEVPTVAPPQSGTTTTSVRGRR